MFKQQRKYALFLGLTLIVLLLIGCQSGESGGENVSTRPEPQSGPDADGDWVSDPDEEKFGTDSSVWDTDGDGSTDFEEIFIVGSDPLKAEGDSDEDYMRDVTEAMMGSDPNNADEDRDFDGIPDSVELKNGSDPGKMDTDGDLLSDFLELYLTETDPAAADPINEFGFPQPLESWLPEHLKNVNCEVATIFTMDEVFVPDPEEADSPSDIIPGDDTYIKYGLWIDVPSDFDLTIEDNTPHTAVWFGKGSQNAVFNREDFRTLNPVFTKCGQIITLAVQALEDDSPFGGIWDMGTWRDDVHLIFNRIPFGWGHSRQDGFRFYGTTHDGDYEYDFIYSFAVQLLSDSTHQEDIVVEFEKHFNNTATSEAASNQDALQTILLTGMLLSLLDSSSGSTYQPDAADCSYMLDGRCVSFNEYQLAAHKSN